MPISERNGKWYWGSKGPFDSRKKAEEVAQAAHASGYEKLLKEGTGGDGSGPGDGVVFTSENAGIFNRTHGGHGVKRHKKPHKKKRQKVLNPEKSTGVEKFEAFMRDRSPIQKAQQRNGPSVDEQIDGHPADQTVVHRQGKDSGAVRKVIDWRKEGLKREMSKDNMPNASMSGVHSQMDNTVESPVPLKADPAHGNNAVQGKTHWQDNKAQQVIQKLGGPSANFANIGPQPNQNNEPGEIETTPQEKYVEKKPKNPPKGQDVKMNDFEMKTHAAEEDVKNTIQLSMLSSGGRGDEQGNYRDCAVEDELDEDELEHMDAAVKQLLERRKKLAEQGHSNALFKALMDDDAL